MNASRRLAASTGRHASFVSARGIKTSSARSNTGFLNSNTLLPISKSPTSTSSYHNNINNFCHLSSSAPISSFTSQPSTRRNFSSATAAMSGSAPFLDAIVQRHSNYALKDTDLPVSDAHLEETFKTVVKNVPSSFNVQSTRLVVLLKDEHKKFWDLVLEVLQPHITPETKGYTEGRIFGFKAAYGTVLFFEDPKPVDVLKGKFPQYADRFLPWTEHASAMHQFALWTAFSADGLGANLQHYNPLVDDKAKAEWKIPADWSLKAQLVFGAKAGAEPEAKEKLPLDQTLFIHGK